MSAGLRCRLFDLAGRERTGEVLSLSVDRTQALLRVRFGPGEDVVLPMGGGTELALFGPELYQPHTFRGRAVQRNSSGGAEAYAFRIDPARRFELELIVDGRQSLRVQPEVGKPVPVELVTDGGERCFACTLQDASVAGVSVSVEWADEKHLVHIRDAGVRILLPELAEARELEAIPSRIRRRTLEGEHLVYGLEFDRGLAPTENSGLRALSAWVEQRFRELSGGARVLRRSA